MIMGGVVGVRGPVDLRGRAKWLRVWGGPLVAESKGKNQKGFTLAEQSGIEDQGRKKKNTALWRRGKGETRHRPRNLSLRWGGNWDKESIHKKK